MFFVCLCMSYRFIRINSYVLKSYPFIIYKIMNNDQNRNIPMHILQLNFS